MHTTPEVLTADGYLTAYGNTYYERRRRHLADLIDPARVAARWEAAYQRGRRRGLRTVARNQEHN